MSIPFNGENLIPLLDVPGHLPKGRNGIATNPATVFRWVKHGRNGVKLETLSIGGRRFTSTEALQRFFDKLTRIEDR